MMNPFSLLLVVHFGSSFAKCLTDLRLLAKADADGFKHLDNFVEKLCIHTGSVSKCLKPDLI